MRDQRGRVIYLNDKIVFLLSGNLIAIGTVVGFTPKKVKIERYTDSYVNTIGPGKCEIITEECIDFLNRKKD